MTSAPVTARFAWIRSGPAAKPTTPLPPRPHGSRPTWIRTRPGCALASTCRPARSSTNDLIFSCRELISYLSHAMTLLPGTVIMTGTPSGARAYARSRRWFLRPRRCGRDRGGRHRHVEQSVVVPIPTRPLTPLHTLREQRHVTIPIHYVVNSPDPGADFRGAPFWSWNDHPSTQRAGPQLRDMKAHGMGGFFMHARDGLETPYMGPEWLECVRERCARPARMASTPGL